MSPQLVDNSDVLTSARREKMRGVALPETGPISNDMLNRKTKNFVLWSPHAPTSPPKLVIGTFQEGTPPTVVVPEPRSGMEMKSVAGVLGLWSVAAEDCGLIAGVVYHYWFEVEDTLPGHQNQRICVCDPFAYTTDWRVAKDYQPAAVVKFDGENLVPCDPRGNSVGPLEIKDLNSLPTNNQLVIYELPTAWARKPRGGGVQRGVGTFRDVLALVDPDETGANFSDLSVAAKGNAYLEKLGINAIEFLPLVDTPLEREWGYAPAHSAAPDMELGFPDGYSSPTANSDLQRLVKKLHDKKIRFISDVVLGFVRDGAYQHISFEDFHIEFDPNNPPPDPDAWSSRAGVPRYPWGSKLLRYVRQKNTYDPTDGTVHSHPPARSLMYTALDRWMQDFCVDGLRLDSIETVANWDFVQEYTQRARKAFETRCQAAGLSKEEADARFLAVGEELSLPFDLLTQGRVDGLWNDRFRQFIRPALFGSNASEEPSFEWTVRKAINSKEWGFKKGTQAINYLTSHDVEGYQKERLCTSFRYARFSESEIERRIKLAFVCLLTAVGIPMILAGEEFADENDLFDITGHVTNNSGKQMDPVDFNRLDGDENIWRHRILEVVKALIELRTTHPALAGDECEFIHTDFTPGRRILAWKRGTNENPVVVVANFSDFESGQFPGSEYRINGWPNPYPGRNWYEVTQARIVPAAWAGREPLFRWEAKVYRLL